MQMKKRPMHHTVVCLPNPPHVDGPVTVHLPAKSEFLFSQFPENMSQYVQTEWEYRIY